MKGEERKESAQEKSTACEKVFAVDGYMAKTKDWSTGTKIGMHRTKQC